MHTMDVLLSHETKQVDLLWQSSNTTVTGR